MRTMMGRAGGHACAALLMSFSVTALPATAQLPEPDPEEVAAVERAVLDYVEGIYEMRPEYIERSVHPELDKFGFARSEAGTWSASPMDFDELVALARTWAGGRDYSSAPKVVEVPMVLDRIATAELVASWGIDAFLLTKEDDRWKIRHAVWQSHTPETMATVRAAIGGSERD